MLLPVILDVMWHLEIYIPLQIASIFDSIIMCCSFLSHPGLSQKKKNSAQGSSPALPRKGIIVVDDEPEREPPPKCCS